MNLIVIDPDYPDQVNKRRWSFMLGREIAPQSTLTCEVKFRGVVFIHNQFSMDDLKAFAQKHDNCVVVIISGGARDPKWEDSDSRYWRKRPVAKPDDAQFARCVQAFLKDFEQTSVPNFTLLESQHDEARLALRLLCEAWVMTGGKDKQQYKQYGDIWIHAPVTPDDWCQPFVDVTSFKALKPDEKLAAIEKHIADLMGDARDDVQIFYKQLVGLDNAEERKVTPADLLKKPTLANAKL